MRHRSGLSGHKAGGCLTFSWSGEGGRAAGPLVSPHAVGSLVTEHGSERADAHEAFRDCVLSWHTFSSTVFCYLKQVTRPTQIQGVGNRLYLSMGEAAKSSIKWHGYRQGQRIGGHFAINIPHWVSLYSTHFLESCALVKIYLTKCWNINCVCVKKLD